MIILWVPSWLVSPPLPIFLRIDTLFFYSPSLSFCPNMCALGLFIVLISLTDTYTLVVYSSLRASDPFGGSMDLSLCTMSMLLLTHSLDQGIILIGIMTEKPQFYVLDMYVSYFTILRYLSSFMYCMFCQKFGEKEQWPGLIWNKCEIIAYIVHGIRFLHLLVDANG